MLLVRRKLATEGIQFCRGEVASIIFAPLSQELLRFSNRTIFLGFVLKRGHFKRMCVLKVVFKIRIVDEYVRQAYSNHQYFFTYLTDPMEPVSDSIVTPKDEEIYDLSNWPNSE